MITAIRPYTPQVRQKQAQKQNFRNKALVKLISSNSAEADIFSSMVWAGHKKYKGHDITKTPEMIQDIQEAIKIAHEKKEFTAKGYLQDVAEKWNSPILP